MKDIDVLDVKDYVLGHILSKGKEPAVFMLSFFHGKKSVIRCIVRLEKSELYENVYHSNFSVKAIDSFFSLTDAAEREFGRISVKMVKELYRPKFLCGGNHHGEVDN